MTRYDDGRTRLELYVRSLSPSGARSRQDAAISRLSTLTERDIIAGYDVHVWGTGVCLDSPAARTESGTFALERLAAFEDWAQRNGLALGSAFYTKEVASTLTGREYIERSFPVLTLAEFSGPALRRVAPCRDGKTTYSVEDCLDAIEGDETFGEEEEPTPLPVDRHRRETLNASLDGNSSPFAASSPLGE